jgi:hypoxanthine phosphoribosyltransferase
MSPRILFPAATIATRIESLARELAALPDRPERLIGVLTGAFIFAADLTRALARQGLDLPVDWLWLSSYGNGRSRGALTLRAAPVAALEGEHILLVDGVLDSGSTLAQAIDLLEQQGARRITTAVVIDKELAQARLRADHACFCGVDAFISGYGLDDQGLGRGRGDIIAL